jgi:calcium uniporter protein, mitochondrial
MHKSAKKIGLDLNEYNEIKREIAEIEYDIRRLNDPLHKNLPSIPPKIQNYSETEISSAKKLKALLAEKKIFGATSLEKISNIFDSAKRLKK